MSKRKQPASDSKFNSPLSSKFKIETPNDVSVWASVQENRSVSSVEFSEIETDGEVDSNYGWVSVKF